MGLFGVPAASVSITFRGQVTMNERQRKHIEQRLLRERDRVLRAMAVFDLGQQMSEQEGTGDLSAYPIHLADEGTDASEREKSYLLATKEGDLIYEINGALRRLYDDPESFGRCHQCGEEIAFERLDIVPWARNCVACQRELEATGRVR